MSVVQMEALISVCAECGRELVGPLEAASWALASALGSNSTSAAELGELLGSLEAEASS